MDCSPPCSSVHGILQARIPSGLPIPSPGDLPDSGMKSTSAALASELFTTEPPGKPTPKYVLTFFFYHFFNPALAHWHYLPSHPWPVFSPLLKGQLKSPDLMKINEIINPSGYGIINERQSKGEKWKGKDRNRRLHSDWHKHHSLFATGTRGAWCLCITVVKRHKLHKLTSVVGEHSHIRKGFQSPGHCHVRPLSLSLTSKEVREEPTLATA